MRDMKSVSFAVVVVAVNAVVFHKVGISGLMIPMILTSLLLALEFTPDPA